MHGGAGGAVFGGNPAGIAAVVQLCTKARQIKAAAARFIAVRKPGNLDVVDAAFVPAPDGIRITVDAGGMPKVCLLYTTRCV